MILPPREQEKLLIYTAAKLARERRDHVISSFNGLVEDTLDDKPPKQKPSPTQKTFTNLISAKKDMIRNDFIGEVSVNPETYDVHVNGEKIESQAVDSVPLARRYFLF